MTKKRMLIPAVLVVLAGAAILTWQITKHDGGEPHETVSIASSDKQTSPSEAAARNFAGASAVQIDDDPVGPLRLEGQVLGHDDLPVKNATVYLSSKPPRQAKTEVDGSFSFDKLVGRRYRLVARSDKDAGGPVFHELGAKSDPVVIRLSRGATVEVTIVSSKSGEPIAGASVSLLAVETTVQTNTNGIATMHAIAPGDAVLAASAKGYAKKRETIHVGDNPKTIVRKQLALDPAALISGMVTSEGGAPIQGAHVLAREPGIVFDLGNPWRDGAKTDAGGRFSMPVAEGNFRFTAVHKENAPATSEIILIDAAGRDDIKIVMQSGGVVAGRVISAQGVPSPWASVHLRIDPDDSGPWGRGGSDVAREATTDEHGEFRIAGVSRRPLVLHARSQQASTDIMRLDMSSGQERTDLVLKLSIEGQIAGTVVDQNGEPIADAQVLALPDFWGGGDIRSLAVRGPSFATTDGGGVFSFRGLPDGLYRVRATRTRIAASQFMDKGEQAKVGDTNLRIVLPSPGGIKGKVLLANGSPPELATVSVSTITGTIAVKGAFEVSNVTPGSYEVILRGPNFPEKIVKDVEVKPGKITDIGTVTVERGRILKGRVLDGSGSPVAAADVVLGRQLLSGGKSLRLEGLGGALEERQGTRRTTTDARGVYRLPGIGKGELVLAAEHKDRGRAAAIVLPAGGADATVDLRLLPFGGIAGKVTVNGQPGETYRILIAPESGAQHIIVSKTSADGTFTIERVGAGEYKVTAMSGMLGAASMTARTAHVVGGEVAHVTLDIVEGVVTLAVKIEGEGDAQVKTAQVFLMNGKVTVANGGEMNKLFLNAAEAGSAKMVFAFGGMPAVFQKLVPGTYSACIIPLSGDLNDPEFAQKLRRNVNLLPVHCRDVEVAATPKEQAMTAVVPPMPPLP